MTDRLAPTLRLQDGQPRSVGVPTLTRAETPLGRTIAQTPTAIWNDSCSIPELEYAISFGADGATANPTIVTDVWRQAPGHWDVRVRELMAERPEATEFELAWAIVEEMSVEAASLLLPAHVASGQRFGRLSMQTDPTLFLSSPRMLAQGQHFASLAPNIIVKLPATSAGIEAIEEATANGISVNVTVCFTVSQALGAAQAIERGLDRYRAAGGSISTMGPVVTLMMGRLEDWLRVVGDRDGIVADPTSLAWSGVAVFKRAYRIFAERGYRAKLLGAAIRHQLHWSELIGADAIITMPSVWQRRFNASDVVVRPRIDVAVDAAVIDELRRHFPDFERAYEPDGLTVGDFDRFGPTVRTLRTFVASYHELLHSVAAAMLPDPDGKP